MRFWKNDTGMGCRLGDQQLELTWFGAEILRVRAWRGSAPRWPSLVVVAQPQAPEGWSVQTTDSGLELRGPSLAARLDEQGRLEFFRQGRALVAERAGSRGFPANNLGRADEPNGCEQGFVLTSQEALYGLGQFPGGVMNWRGQRATLIHGNVTVVVPFLVSTNGWGVLWDNASHTEFADGPEGMRLWSEVADGVEYYLVAGANADQVIAGYRHLTGAAPLFARAFYGFIQSKERYKTATELVDVVREHRRRQLPLDVIVQDWLYWGPGQERWSAMRHDPAVFGDLPQAVREIHQMHAKLMISIWPRIGVASPLGQELATQDLLFVGRPADQDKVYDAYSPVARDIYWRHAKQGLFDLGIDAWWMDGTEPEFEDCHDTQRHKKSCLAQRDTVAGSWARLLNAYSLATTGGVYHNQRAVTSAKRVFILTRSAFAGQQRHAAATWSGDISANWPTFVVQIPAGLNFCLAGIPYWTTDNGAFFISGRGGLFPKGVADPAYREFYLRWFQYSCFCPLMRSHGTQTPRELWHFGRPGEPIYDALADFLRLRMRLLPYSYSLAALTTFAGYTPMRALAMDFPEDPQVHGIADQFMYGPALLACPVTRPLVHIPRDNLSPFGSDDIAVEGKGGWFLRMFDGLDASQPSQESLQRCFLDLNWSGNLPAGVSSPSYRAEITGNLSIPAAGATALIVRVAGRVRVDLAGQRVVEDWVDGPTREHRIPLDAQLHKNAAFRVSYGHLNGEALLQVGWEMNQAWANVTPAAVCERELYLPATDWYDFWTGERLAGGRKITRPAPLAHIPVLVRAGSILLLGPDKQWQDEIPDDPIEVRVYPGANGAFTLYEDAGDSYAYENGQFSRIEFHWDDARQTLRIGARAGSFPGILAQRRFRIVRVGAGIGPAPAFQECPYDGTAQQIRLA